MRAKEPDIDEITKWLKVKKVKESSGYYYVLKAGMRAGQVKQNIADRFDCFCIRNGS